MQSQETVVNKHLLKVNSEVLSGMVEVIHEARIAANSLAENPNVHTAKRAENLIRKLNDFAPSITLIGQVKAGKTALMNSLVGIPGLLPSDINPWTSVVTELFLNHDSNAIEQQAKFSFFTRNEWDNLVNTGGRLGELAGRAGADEEVEKIEKQVIEMRENTEARLGSSFEMLLGKSHKYDSYNDELLQRYVCAGDPDEEAADPENKQGRFADITKSAELDVSIPEFPISMRFRDTPGVNDTFMVREQVTLKSLRGSEICLVVLSAHQALNTTDMALIRMMTNFEKRQVILFVNRIDELANPSQQIPEIRENITETLQEFSDIDEIEIIFGSAKWAEAALFGNQNSLTADSQVALSDYAQNFPEVDTADAAMHSWVLSGVPALMESIYNRILEGAGKRLLDNVASQLSNFYNEVKVEQGFNENFSNSGEIIMLETDQVKIALDNLTLSSRAELNHILDKMRTNLHSRLERAQGNFVQRATEALISHLERYGEQDTWQYDATGLRILFRSAYVQFAARLRKQVSILYGETSNSIEEIYFRAVGFKIEGFKIEPPSVPAPPPPVVLARTIALDLNSSWWGRWWQKRKGFEAFAQDYSNLIQAEVASLMQELEGEQIQGVLQEVRDDMKQFVSEQRETLVKMSENRGNEPLLLVSNTGEKNVKDALEDALAALDNFAA